MKYAIVNTNYGRCNRNLSALEVLNKMNYSVENSDGAFLVVFRGRGREIPGAKGAQDAAERYLRDRMGKSQFTAFDETSLDSCVMPESRADRFIAEQSQPADFYNEFDCQAGHS